MTLAKARAEANKVFRETKAAIIAKKVSPRRASELIIFEYWRINQDLEPKDRNRFHSWFNRKHDELGREMVAK